MKKPHHKNGDSMKVKKIMSKSIIAANASTSISEVCRNMKEYDIGFIPIQNNDDFVGVITDRDIVIRAISKGADINDSVEKYITNHIISINSNADVGDAIELMSEEQVKRLLVEEKGKIIGILSLSDILSIKKDLEVLEYIANIFSPFDRPVLKNEVNLIEAEIDQFDL